MHRAILPQFSGGGKAREKTLQPGADAKKAPPPSPLSAPSPTAALCRRPAAVLFQWALSATQPNEPLQRPPLAGTRRSRWRRKEAGQGIGGGARRTQRQSAGCADLPRPFPKHAFHCRPAFADGPFRALMRAAPIEPFRNFPGHGMRVHAPRRFATPATTGGASAASLPPALSQPLPCRARPFLHKKAPPACRAIFPRPAAYYAFGMMFFRQHMTDFGLFLWIFDIFDRSLFYAPAQAASNCGVRVKVSTTSRRRKA